MKKLDQFKNKKLVSIIIPIIILITTVYSFILAQSSSYIGPNYEKINIESILKKDKLLEDDYKILFYQTGLGKIAIDEILSSKDKGLDEILKFQEYFFADVNTSWKRSSFFIKKESIVNDNGQYKYGFNLAPYKNGYVLISKSTQFLGWRHGHSGIITDSAENEFLEAVGLGANSKLRDINDWRVSPTFIMLKLKDVHLDTLNEISNFAKENMNDMPYKLTVGLLSAKNPDLENLKGTHCSHLIWYAFNQFGFDIDSRNSLIVTPKDILNSDLFEVVQIYGVDPVSFVD